MKALQEAGKLLAQEKGGLTQVGSGQQDGSSGYESGLQGGLSGGESGLQSGLSDQRIGLFATAQAILKLLDENPSMTYDEISIRLGKARSGIAKHIRNLREKGFIK